MLLALFLPQQDLELIVLSVLGFNETFHHVSVLSDVNW